jgi:hypothetical protein
VIPLRDLISAKYCKAQKVMHANPRGYGRKGHYWAPTVIEVAQRYDVQSICDYGAGQRKLGEALRAAGFICRDYDPAIPGIDGPPSFADMVVSTDMLEHCEPHKLENVLAHIRMLARKAVFIVVACRPAQKLLPNGDNAHLIIQPKGWWQEKLIAAGFTIQPRPTVLPEKMPSKCWMGVLTP